MINQTVTTSVQNLKLWDVVSSDLFQYAALKSISEGCTDIRVNANPNFQGAYQQAKRSEVLENGVLVKKEWLETVDRSRNDPSRATAFYLVLNVAGSVSHDTLRGDSYSNGTIVKAQRMHDEYTPDFKGEIIEFGSTAYSNETPIRSVNLHRNMSDE